MKFLHTMGAIGLMGAMASFLVLLQHRAAACRTWRRMRSFALLWTVSRG